MSDIRQQRASSWDKTSDMNPDQPGMATQGALSAEPTVASGSWTGSSSRLDHNACYSAISRKDGRFDGRFYTGVTSTGIFCRPSCPARTPRPSNVRFFPHPASAVEAGFRPCRRCRPELAPGHREWNRRQDLVGRAVSLIDQGALDSQSVVELAARLGVSERHLRRELKAELGTGPVQLARTRRLWLARTLLDQTALTVSDIAFASGFASIRQFNDVFKGAFDATPSELRRRPRPDPNQPSSLVLHIPSRGPLRWPDLHQFLCRRAVDGMEEAGRYTFSRRVPGGRITLGDQSAFADPECSSLRVEFDINDLARLATLVPMVRQVCDLEADLDAITAALHADETLASIAPDLVPRLPGAFDPFEIAVRAVVGQQVSVAAARTTIGRIVAIAADGAEEEQDDGGGFPTPEQLLAAPLDEVGMPERRRATIRDVAQAVSDGTVDLTGSSAPDAVAEQLLGVRGVGPWTAGYIVMRALQHPDAWPVDDLVLVQTVARAAGLDRDELAKRSNQWKPWRAYAALSLWKHSGEYT